ncbi:hypothetical protein N7583_06950 [Serratia marcescens]|nr:JAB domain-containing protein [Serratia marcescens]MDT0225504.1 hypothetical protein [Serratia marcescens]
MIEQRLGQQVRVRRNRKTVKADRLIKVRLKQALELMDIRLLDHLVVGSMDIISFTGRDGL